MPNIKSYLNMTDENTFGRSEKDHKHFNIML